MLPLAVGQVARIPVVELVVHAAQVSPWPPVNYFSNRFLGSSYNETEVDAGFAWDTEGLAKYHIDPAWTVFVRAGNVWTNYAPDGVDVWHKPKGSLGSSIGMTYQANPDGTVRLTVSGLASAGAGFDFGAGASPSPDPAQGPHPPKVNKLDDGSGNFSVYSPGLMATMAVKRVVAMTQSGAGTPDGSYMNFVGFSNGSLSTTQRDAAGNLNFVQVKGGWPITAVNQEKTGYDKAGWAYPASPADPMWTSGPDTRRWIVDFDFDGMAQPHLRGPADTQFPNGEYRDAETAARYLSEKVSINLGLPPAKVDGVHLRRTGKGDF